MPVARVSLQKALELNPRCLNAYMFLGQMLQQQGEPERAYGYFKKVLELSPNHVEAQGQVRVIEMRRQKPEKKGLFDKLKKK